MDSFIKVYSGYTEEIENKANEYARKRNLTIVSASITINQGRLYLSVVYEKTGIDLRKEDEGK